MTDDDEIASVIKQMTRTMSDIVTAERDRRRPLMEDVVRVMDLVLGQLNATGELDMVADQRGPEMWSWRNMRLQRDGFEHVYVLTGSNLPGAEGYPLMTIRKVIAPHFDANLTFSTLIFGPSDDEIMHAIAMLITNHNAAFYGLSDTVSVMASQGTGAAIEELRERRESREQIELTDVPKPKGELN